MVAAVQSETAIGEATAMAVAPGAVVDDWAAIDPWSIGGVGLAGCVLLLVGGRLLKPALVLAIASLGAMLGLMLAGAARDGSLPGFVNALGIPPVVWVVVVPLFLGIAAAVLARVALALLLGASLATAVLLIGLMMATGGRALDPSTESTPAAEVSSAAVDGDAGDLGDRLEDAATDAVVRQLQQELVGEGVIPDLDQVRSWLPNGLAAWWRKATAGLEPGMIDLLVAFATVTGICGFMLALLLPERTAMVATSICGGWLVSGALTAGWVRLLPDTSPPTPFVTLLAWAVLAAMGVLYQGRRGRRARRAERE